MNFLKTIWQAIKDFFTKIVNLFKKDDNDAFNDIFDDEFDD